MRLTFSIIIPFFNGSIIYLNEALESVICQDYDLSLIEVVIYQDGGEKILSNEIFRQFKEVDIVLIINEKNRGISYARNQAILKSSNDFILLLDHDDTLSKQCVSSFNEFILIDQIKSDVYFSNALKYDSSLLRLIRTIDSSYHFKEFERIGFSRENPAFSTIFFGPCIVLKKKSFFLIGMFNENFVLGEITELMLRYFVNGFIIRHLNKFLYNYRDNHSGLSKSTRLNEFRIKGITQAYTERFSDEISLELIGRHPQYLHTQFMVKLK